MKETHELGAADVIFCINEFSVLSLLLFCFRSPIFYFFDCSLVLFEWCVCVDFPRGEMSSLI